MTTNENRQIIVTIGRENGSGGKAVGERLASELGVKCYDKSLFYLALKEKNFAPEVFQKFDESPGSIFSIMYSYNASNFGAQLFQAQCDLIQSIVDKGESCVIIGRCADYILRDHPNVVKVFLYADTASKAARTMEKHHLSEEEALRWNQKNDKNRRAYYREHTMQQWGELKNYHLCIDTSEIGVEGTTKLILQYLAERSHVKPE